MAHITHAVESIIFINVVLLIIKLFADFIRAVRFYEWQPKINRMTFEERVTSFRNSVLQANNGEQI